MSSVLAWYVIACALTYAMVVPIAAVHQRCHPDWDPAGLALVTLVSGLLGAAW